MASNKVEITVTYLTLLTHLNKFEGKVDIKPEIRPLVFTLFLVCKLYPRERLKKTSSVTILVVMKFWFKFQFHTMNRNGYTGGCTMPPPPSPPPIPPLTVLSIL